MWRVRPGRGALLAAGLGVLLSGCALAADPAPAVRRLAEVGQLQTTGFDAAVQLVIADQASWRDAWLRMVSLRRPVPSPPEIDFTKEIVVVVAMGQQRSGGHSVRIVAVERLASGVRVQAVLEQPGAGCITSANITSPADVVVLPVTVRPVTFDLRRVTRDCN